MVDLLEPGTPGVVSEHSDKTTPVVLDVGSAVVETDDWLVVPVDTVGDSGTVDEVMVGAEGAAVDDAPPSPRLQPATTDITSNTAMRYLT